MSPAVCDIVSSLQRSGTFINTLIAALTIGGQQLFSSFTFSCPCQAGKNFYYGSAFLIIPALILLVAGFALRSQTWTITSEYCCSCVPQLRKISLLERRLACLHFFGITGRALVAPLTWLAVTLLTGTYYECAASEFASVDHYRAFDNISAGERQEILAGFPCCRSVPSNMILVRDEVALLHRYQSQVSSCLLFSALLSRVNWGFPGGSVVKNLPSGQEMLFDPWVGEIAWRRTWQPTPVLAWEVARTEQPGALSSMRSQKN